MRRVKIHFSHLIIVIGLAAMLLSGCGSGGPGNAPSEAVADALGSGLVVLMVSSPQLNSDGASTVVLTALVRDTKNVAMAGQKVSFSCNNGGVITVTSEMTDDNGMAKATLGTGFDPTNRTITVTATSGSASATNTVNVVSTALDISGLSSISFTTPTTLTISLKDSSGAGIAGRTISVSSSKGNTLSAASYVTNNSGQITVTVTPTAAGMDTITATAIGATKTFALTVNAAVLTITAPTTSQEITINTAQTLTARYTSAGAPVVGAAVTFATTRGALSSATAFTDGNGDAMVTVSASQTGPAVLSAFVTNGPSSQVPVEFVATTAKTVTLQVSPAVIGTNSAGATTEKSLVTAVVRDVNNNLVKNKIVVFSSDTDASGGSYSPVSAITDSSGNAGTYFIGGPAPGSVTVRATETATGVTTTIPLTVAKKALFITLSTGNKIVAKDDTKYQKDYVALVTDSVGNPVVGATVTARLTPVYYKKGYYLWSTVSSKWYPVETLVAASSTLPNIPACSNEDCITRNPLYDYNGILDPGEDVNGNGKLDPQNVASVTATTTDSTGHSVISIVYAKNFAYWVNVRLEAWASDLKGSTTNASVTFDLPILADDLTSANIPPPGQPSPFGTSQTCLVDLTLVPVTASRIDLSWTPSAQAASYNIYRNGSLAANATTNSYSDTGLLTSTNYCYQIYWVNTFGVQTRWTDQICSATLSTPAAPLNLTANAVSSTQINLAWTAATNAVGYKLYRDHLYIKSVTANGTTDVGLTPNTTYLYTVTAYDAMGNESAPSSTVSATTYLTTPTAPTGLAAVSISMTQIDLSWTAVAGAAGYHIYRTGGGSAKTMAADTPFMSDVALLSQTQYCYRISTFDVSGNESAQSNQVCTATK